MTTVASLLVIVSGAPGSGKTTLARLLSEALPLPLLAKDTFREIVADAFGFESVEESRALIRPTFAVYMNVLDEMLEAGVGVIAECNFYCGLAEPELTPLAAHARAVIVHCQTSRELSVRRFIERAHRGQRHRCFFDGERSKELEAGELPDAWERAEPVEIGAPIDSEDVVPGWTLPVRELFREAHEAS